MQSQIFSASFNLIHNFIKQIYKKKIKYVHLEF